MASPLDPRFLLLPHLEKASKNFVPLEQIVQVTDDFKLPGLKNAINWKLDEVCDVKSLGDDEFYYRFNTLKTLTWLKNKVDKISKIISKQRQAREERLKPCFVNSFQATADLPSQENIAITVSSDDTKTAVEIMCDYLSESLSSSLMTEYNLKTSDFNTKSSLGKRKADWEVALEQEKESVIQKVVPPPSQISGNNNSSNVAVKKDVKGIKLNEVAAKGTKSIHSFFGKKN
jgi:hypothetical protein